MMDTPTHRACGHCRSLKTRCLVNDADPTGPCERCVRFGRQCIFTPLQKRRPRKRTDTRVAELEKEMTALRSLLKPGQAGTDVDASQQIESSERRLTEGGHSIDMTPPRAQASAVTTSSTSPSDWTNETGSTTSNRRSDPVTRGILSMDLACQLVEVYKTDLYRLNPMVWISPSRTAEELRRTKPTLFLAILASTAGKEWPDIAAKLDQIVLEEYANRVVLESEKSLELVQSLLISSTWYQPPTKLNQFKYTEYVHMACRMAVGIGIGSRPLDSEGWADRGTASLESRRTFIAALCKAAGIAMSDRKPTPIRLSSWALDCLRQLEDSPSAAPGDRMLASWTRLAYIADEILSAFDYDDPGAVASIVDIKTQLMMDAFRNRLRAWRQACADFDDAPALQMTYHAVQAYLREVILYVDHRPEDFTVPYRVSAMTAFSEEAVPVKPVVNGLAELVDASHSLLDSFTSITPSLTRALPLGLFVRVSYACFVLAKLCTSASHTRSRLSALIDRPSLDAENYVNRTLLHVRNSIGPNQCRLPAIFLNLLTQMREWCVHPELVHQLEPNLSPPEDAAGGKATFSPGVSENTAESSPDTMTSASTVGVAALTGTFAANYERFGNAEAVDSAAHHGREDQTVNILDTLSQVNSTLSGRVVELGEVPSGVSANEMKQPWTVAEEVFQGLDGSVDWAAQMDQMWCDDNTLSALDSMDNLMFDEMTGLDHAS